MIKNRHFKPCDAAIEIKESQRRAEINVISGFSKKGLIGQNLRGFDIVKFYQRHPELLHEFTRTEAGLAYRALIFAIVESDVITLAKQPNDNSDALSEVFIQLHKQLANVINHSTFIGCTHLFDEYTNCLTALYEDSGNTLINKAILDVLSSMLTKLYEAKK